MRFNVFKIFFLTFITSMAGMAAIVNQEQQRVAVVAEAVGPGNWHFISVARRYA